VLDEIFAVGDAAFKARCADRYRTLSAAGHTVVIVSHDPNIVSTFCTHALLLDNGRVLLEGTGPDVAAAYLQLMRPNSGR
jgi:ABC-type polysaccharide/polyol phosphate transport system ATPase subunit